MNTARKIFREKFIQSPHAMVSDVYEKRGEVHRLIGKYDKALGDFNVMKNINCYLKNNIKKADSIFQTGNVYLNKGDLDNAENYLLEGLDLYKQINNRRGVASCYRQLGVVSQFREKNNESERYYNDALNIFIDLNDIEGKYSLFVYLADNYYKLKKNDNALSILEEIINFYEKTNNRVKLIRPYQISGKVLLEKGDFQNGVQYLNKAYKISIEIGENISTIYSLCDLGIAYYENEDFVKAKELFKHCLSMSEKQDMIYMQAVSLLNLGDTCFKLNEYAIAKSYLEKVNNININIAGIKEEAQRILREINFMMKGGENI